MTQAEPITQDEIDLAKPAICAEARNSKFGGRPLANLVQATAATQAALLHAFPPDRIVATLERLMDAKVTVVRGRGADARELHVDDWRIQLEAAKLMIAYTLGLPVQRSEAITVNLDADSAAGLSERLRASPALREQMRKLLNESDAVEVTTTVEQ